MPLTEDQVRLALVNAGIEPVESPATIAAAIGGALAAASPAFAALPFDAEPPAYLAVLMREEA